MWEERLWSSPFLSSLGTVSGSPRIHETPWTLCPSQSHPRTWLRGEFKQILLTAERSEIQLFLTIIVHTTIAVHRQCSTLSLSTLGLRVFRLDGHHWVIVIVVQFAHDMLAAESEMLHRLDSTLEMRWIPSNHLIGLFAWAEKNSSLASSKSSSPSELE